MSENVRTELRENGDDIVLTKTIDDEPFRDHCREQRHMWGNGFVRDERGAAIGRRLFSIPIEEANMLAAQKDPDWEEWWNTDSNRALMRLIQRFPHWVCCEGGGLI
jgi:hypothetical protein